jgi:monofunctional chorismate mutase
MLDLGEIRENIDNIDKQLVQLFEERMRLTGQVAEFKLQTGKKVLDEERERQKLEAINKLVTKKENEHPIDDLFSHIMANSRKWQYMLLEKNGQSLREPFEIVDKINTDNIKVVYQGVPGAYAYAAMIDYFGEDIDNFNVSTWKDAMEAVKEGKADYAVLPIENSTTGSITAVYDLLQEYNNYIVAEVYVKVEHVLMGLVGTDLSKVTTVYSHAQGLTQCESFLESHKDWQQISQPNTAVAAKKIFEMLISVQGIGPKAAISILSLAEAEDVRNAIANADAGFIAKASGVGKKSAERVIVDLKDKVGIPSHYGATDVKFGGAVSQEPDEALDALIALGFPLKEATAALEKVDKNLPGEERIKLALTK